MLRSLIEGLAKAMVQRATPENEQLLSFLDVDKVYTFFRPMNPWTCTLLQNQLTRIYHISELYSSRTDSSGLINRSSR